MGGVPETQKRPEAPVPQTVFVLHIGRRCRQARLPTTQKGTLMTGPPQSQKDTAMIHHTTSQRQAQSLDVPAPDTGAGPAPACCPCCGRPYDLFDHDTSRLLDLVLVSREALSTAEAALSTLTHALEEDLP